MAGKRTGGVRVGKRLRDTVYIHRSASGWLGEADAALLSKACGLQPDAPWNVARVTRSGEVGLMLYEDFETSHFPALLRSTVVDTKTGSAKSRDWAAVSSPPIIHRKELMLPPGFPGLAEFAALTAALEAKGVFAEPTKIGTRGAWAAILERAGVRVEGHRVHDRGSGIAMDGEAAMTGERVPHVRIEYDPDFDGGDYSGVGKFLLAPASEVERDGAEAVFTRMTGLPDSCMIHYTVDELYDAQGERLEDSERERGGPGL